MLEAEEVEVRRGGRLVAGPASFQVQSGEILALVGPNGAGKSSLLKAVTGEWPANGEVRIAGRRRRTWARPELARVMAVMPQQARLGFDFLVEEVIAMGRLPHIRKASPERDRQAIEKVMDLLDLHAFRARRYLSLSGGERQRVQLARVLAQLGPQPAQTLLLLDEPTSALDLAQAQQALGAIRRYANIGAAVAVVLHDLSLAAAYADRVLVLQQGRIRTGGSPASVFRTENIEKWFGCPVRIEFGHEGTPLIGPINGRAARRSPNRD